MARFPEDVCINAERWALIRSSSRLAVEMDLIETWCPALRPTYFRAPDNDDRIDGIRYRVPVEAPGLHGHDTVRLEMVVPEDYPASVPRIYLHTPELPASAFDARAHMYRDSEDRIHMCILFPEDWTEDYTMAGMMIRSVLWVNKYAEFLRTGIWPGRGQAHCTKCGKRLEACTC